MMDTKRLLKNLMFSANIGMIMFFLNLAIGWFVFNSMVSMLTATLPFLIIAIVSFISSSVIEEIETQKVNRKVRLDARKVMRYRNTPTFKYHSYTRKIA